MLHMRVSLLTCRTFKQHPGKSRRAGRKENRNMVALIQLALIAAALAGLWKTFEKMGRKGWEGIVH